MARKVSVPGSVVRAWAAAEGADEVASAGLTVGKRGRLDAQVVELFEKHTGKRYAVGHVAPVQVKGIRLTDSGRKVPVQLKVQPAELRAFAVANGGGQRGRISAETRAAFAARGR